MLMFKLLLVYASALIVGVNMMTMVSDDEVDNRLPKNVYPDLYALSLLVNNELLVYAGNVTISFRVVNPTASILLNHKDISVDWLGAILKDKDKDRRITIVNVNVERSETAVLQLREPLMIGTQYTLLLSFNGEIRKDSIGLFVSSYEINNSERRMIFGTKLYPNYARTVFPCFDEPEFRAKFQLNLYLDEFFTALSNVPESKITGPQPDNQNYVLSKFPETPKMSPHSFGFIIAEYASSTEQQRVRIYAPTADNVSSAQWTQQFASRALEFTETLLDRPYQLPNVNLVAADNSQDMEIYTWGLIRIPANILYYDNNNQRESNPEVHQNGAAFVVNQLSRAWFTHEIASTWWNYHWLNDGFAKYLEYLIGSQLNPEWRLLDQFGVKETQLAFTLDDKISTQPITTPAIYEPNAIRLSTSENLKAGPIIRMIESIIGKEVFKNIVRRFAVKGSLGTVTPDHLFEIIQAEVNRTEIQLPATVKQIFESWTMVRGFPVIKLTRHYGDASKMTILQKRFVINDSNEKQSGEKWPEQYVPVSVSSKESLDFNDTTPSVWLIPNAPIVSYTLKPVISANSWIIANNQQAGFYRVNYDRTNWRLLIHALSNDDFDHIHVFNRAQLVDDSFHLAKSGERDFEIPFGIFGYLRKETDFIPWKPAARSLTFLEHMLRGRAEHNLLESFIRNITKSVYHRVPVTRNETDHVLRLQRLDVAKLACEAGLQECVKEVIDIFDQIILNSHIIMPEAREIIFCTAAKYSAPSSNLSNTIIEYILTLFSKQETAADKEELYQVINGLGCLQDKALIYRYLEITVRILPPNLNVELTKRDRQTIFQSIISGSYVGTRAALGFMKNNFSAMKLRFESLASLFDFIGQFIVTEEIQKLFDDIVVTHKTKLTEKMRLAIARSTVIGESNLKWLKIHHTDISKWLTENVPVEDEPSSASIQSLNVIVMVMVTIVSVLLICNTNILRLN